jgi:hypothetical protein
LAPFILEEAVGAPEIKKASGHDLFEIPEQTARS